MHVYRQFCHPNGVILTPPIGSIITVGLLALELTQPLTGSREPEKHMGELEGVCAALALFECTWRNVLFAGMDGKLWDLPIGRRELGQWLGKKVASHLLVQKSLLLRSLRQASRRMVMCLHCCNLLKGAQQWFAGHHRHPLHYRCMLKYCKVRIRKG